MFELKIVSQFAAAHQLKMVAEKCENLHGHNWKVEACVAGEDLNPAGVLIDFGELKNHLHQIMETLDHKFLNALELFDGNPSSENIARYISDLLQAKIDDKRIRVSRITVWESDNASATYIPNPIKSPH
ncbi:MAG: 6-carboxytetrahydropterin synthase QueD [Thermodesulfobacteriota bacterium]